MNKQRMDAFSMFIAGALFSSSLWGASEGHMAYANIAAFLAGVNVWIAWPKAVEGEGR